MYCVLCNWFSWVSFCIRLCPVELVVWFEPVTQIITYIAVLRWKALKFKIKICEQSFLIDQLFTELSDQTPNLEILEIKKKKRKITLFLKGTRKFCFNEFLPPDHLTTEPAKNKNHSIYSWQGFRPNSRSHKNYISRQIKADPFYLLS